VRIAYKYAIRWRFAYFLRIAYSLQNVDAFAKKKAEALRAALFNESGQDKSILEGISSPFLNYDRNDLSVVIEFVPKLKKEDFEYCFETIVESMEEIYDASGYGWGDDDKERELSEQGARFLLLRDKSSEDQQIIRFIHLRFTVQGEVIDQMMGEICLYVLDMHLEKEIQKDDDKETVLSEQGARFLLLRDKSSEDQRIIRFIHLRFTVQGEVNDQMMGEICLYVLDVHLEKEIQKDDDKERELSE
jgi:hypothetical protein